MIDNHAMTLTTVSYLQTLTAASAMTLTVEKMPCAASVKMVGSYPTANTVSMITYRLHKLITAH